MGLAATAPGVQTWEQRIVGIITSFERAHMKDIGAHFEEKTWDTSSHARGWASRGPTGHETVDNMILVLARLSEPARGAPATRPGLPGAGLRSPGWGDQFRGRWDL